jgi:glycosyltransferase involved in cell wall biosynthesis
MRLSVITPTFNGAGILQQTFDALSDQDVDFEWELVCPDNGSTDPTAAAIDALASRFRHLVRVDASQQRGVGYARNIGVGASRGEVLVFIDQDDVVRPGYLAAMSAALDEAPLVAARMDGATLNPGVRDRIVQVDEVPVAFDRMKGASGGSMGIRRALFDALGGFDTSVGVSDDIDLCWRAQLAGVEIRFVPDAVLMYRYRSALRSLFKQGLRYGVAASIMHRRYAALLPRIDSGGKHVHGRAQLRRLLARDPGALQETALMIGWRLGSYRARKIDVRPLTRADIPNVGS